MKKQICMLSIALITKKRLFFNRLYNYKPYKFCTGQFKKRIYLKATLITNQSKEFKGFIASISDSAVALSQRTVTLQRAFNAQTPGSNIDYSNISIIKREEKEVLEEAHGRALPQGLYPVHLEG